MNKYPSYLIHYGRSIKDGAPGVGTGNWRRLNGASSKTNDDDVVQKMFSDKFVPSYKKAIKDKAYKKKLIEIADLGLKAFQRAEKKGRPYSYGDNSINGMNREWFLFEDQTFGMPQVAHFINEGYSANQVKKLIDYCDSQEYSYDDPLIFYIQESDPERLKNFTDDCEAVKKQK